MQLTVFWKTNFALYQTYKKEIWKHFIRTMAFFSIYLLLATLMYLYIIVPSKQISDYAKLNAILRSRLRFLNKTANYIEVKKKYIEHCYDIIEKHKFSKIWSIIWPMLSQHLPENAWIEKVVWQKEGTTSYAMHVIIGIEKNQNQLKQINEFIRELSESKIMEYFSSIEINEMSMDTTKYSSYFHITFLPNKQIRLEI